MFFWIRTDCIPFLFRFKDLLVKHIHAFVVHNYLVIVDI